MDAVELAEPDLTDAIEVLCVLSGIGTLSQPNKVSDVDGDGRIGMAEALYILQTVAGMR